MTLPKAITYDTKSKLPYPNDAIKMLMDAHRTERLSTQEVEAINEIIFAYLNVRAHLLYGDEL